MRNFDIALFAKDGEQVNMVFVDNECDYHTTSNTLKTEVKDILRIRSKEQISMQVPFYLKTKLNDECWFEYKVEHPFKDREYNVSFIINPIPPETDLKISFDSKKQDRLAKDGYQLYRKKIVSNSVLLY